MSPLIQIYLLPKMPSHFNLMSEPGKPVYLLVNATNDGFMVVFYCINGSDCWTSSCVYSTKQLPESATVLTPYDDVLAMLESNKPSPVSMRIDDFFATKLSRMTVEFQ